MRKELWEDTYAATDAREYWAVGTEAWFNSIGASGLGENYPAKTRDKVMTYDPNLAALLTEVFKDNEWKYSCPTTD